jgi:hypothetical protein
MTTTYVGREDSTELTNDWEEIIDSGALSDISYEDAGARVVVSRAIWSDCQGVPLELISI